MTKLIFDAETTGLLDNLFERILCICVYNVDKKEEKVFISEKEDEVIEQFFDYLKQNDSPILYGYNSDSFDIPFIIRRAVIHKKRIPRFNNIDLRKRVNGFAYSYNRQEKGKLRDWATALGIPVTTENGSEMFRLFSEKKFDEIKAHCLEDIKITTKLYEHAEFCGLL